MPLNSKVQDLATKLVGTAAHTLGEEYVTYELKQRLFEIAENSINEFEEKLISITSLVHEAIISEIIRLEEQDPNAMTGIKVSPLGNRGILTDRGDTTHQFKTKNICGYFLDKFELCALDGRMCPYDTETYLVCKRYKEGIDKQIPGKNGKVPDEPPQPEIQKDDVNPDNRNA